MRFSRSILMFSLSVFLLAVSWSLISGDLVSIRRARAQTGGEFTAMTPYGSHNTFFAITGTGDVWRFQTDSNGQKKVGSTLLGEPGGESEQGGDGDGGGA